MTDVYIPNHAKYKLAKGGIDLESDTFKMILCNGLSFDVDSHATYTDVSGSELSTGSGYTVGGAAASQDGSMTENDTDDKAEQAFSDVQWDASGGSIGPFQQAVLYDDDSDDDTIVAAWNFDSSFTIADGSSFAIKDVVVSLT